MPYDEDTDPYLHPASAESKPRYSESGDRYSKSKTRARRRKATFAAPATLEAQTARFEVYPNEIAVFSLDANFSVDNDTETVIIFNQTDTRWAMEQGLSRDLTNLDRISLEGTPSGMVYEVEGFVQFAADADGYRQVAIDSEDGLAYQVLACIMPVTTASIPTVVPFQGTLVRQETDTYIQLKVRHTAGAALNIEKAQLHVMRIH